MLRVLSLNVRTESRQHDLVKAFIRETNPHLVLLEEVDDEWLKKHG